MLDGRRNRFDNQLMSRTDPIDKQDSIPGPRSARRRRRGDRADGEALLTLTKPIANWQARWAWMCSMWGLIPGLGLPLGVLGLIFGFLGWRRVRRHPEDLGIRHAIGALIMGTIEILVHLVGLGCLAKGLMEIGLL